jgi:DNA-binding transcriptional LysR family regulator
VRLLQRTTRRVAKTEIGSGYYERVAVALAAVEEAESFVRGRSALIRGTLKISVPTSFGRLHIVPWLKGFLNKHPNLSLDAELIDDLSDVVAEGFDLAIHILSRVDSAVAIRKLSPNRRVICASGEYLKKYGTPRNLLELKNHRTLSASNNTNWLLDGPNGRETFKTKSVITTNSSDLVREETLSGMGISLCSTWDVGTDLRLGKLRCILPEYRGSSDVGIYAVYPSSHHVPPKVRAFVEYLAKIYGSEPYWDKGLTK